GAIKRHESDDVFETVSFKLAQHIAHAGAFKLEHANRFTTAEHVVGLLVFERQLQQVDFNITPRDKLHRAIKYGQRFQAEKVELHKARGFYPFHVELGDGHVGARVA